MSAPFVMPPLTAEEAEAQRQAAIIKARTIDSPQGQALRLAIQEATAQDRAARAGLQDSLAAIIAPRTGFDSLFGIQEAADERQANLTTAQAEASRDPKERVQEIVDLLGPQAAPTSSLIPGTSEASTSSPARSQGSQLAELQRIAAALTPEGSDRTAEGLESLQARADEIFANLEAGNEAPGELTRGQRLQRVLAGLAGGANRALRGGSDREIGIADVLAGAGPAGLAAEIQSQDQIAQGQDVKRQRAADLASARLQFDANMLRVQQSLDQQDFQREVQGYQLAAGFLQRFGPEAERARALQELQIERANIEIALKKNEIAIASDPQANFMQTSTARGQALRNVSKQNQPYVAAAIAVRHFGESQELLQAAQDQARQTTDPVTGQTFEELAGQSFGQSPAAQAEVTRRLNVAVEQILIEHFAEAGLVEALRTVNQAGFQAGQFTQQF